MKFGTIISIKLYIKYNLITSLSNDIDNVKLDLGALGETINGSSFKNYIEGKNLRANSIAYTVIDDEGSCISEDIPITWIWQVNDYVRFYYNDETNVEYQIWFLDSNKTPIKFYGRNPAPGTYRGVKMPANSAYIRFSFKNGTIGKLDDYKSSPVVYWTAGEAIGEIGIIQKIGDLDGLDTEEKESLVDAINEVEGKISAFENISPEDTTFFHISKNMVDPSKCVDGEYVNQETGVFGTLSGHIRTDYIEIEPATDYVFRAESGAMGANFRYVFYKDDKTRISGAVGALPSMVMTSPANAKYVVISNAAYSGRNFMIAPYVNEDKTFEYFDNVYVLPQYIVKGDADDIILNVPSKVYALVGYETNIYFENITEDWTKYNWDVTCTKGMQLERGYRITPVASDAGTYTLTIRASISDAIYKEVSTTLVVTSASAGNGQNKKIIVLGDSTTDNGTVISKLNENFGNDVMGVATLGTRGTSPNNHEGRSGWKFADYFTKASITYTDGRGTIYNPFYNPSTQTFDASYYFANSGIAIPDVFIVNMGINDVFGYLTDVVYDSNVTTILQRAESAVQSILDATTTTKVCVCLTIPPNHSQDAFGKAYGCSQTRDRYKRNNTLWVKSLIEQFSNRESERVYIIPINACLDTVYNMGMETLPVNARNTDVTYQSPISNGGVHPVASGYWQIADVYTAFIKANA